MTIIFLSCSSNCNLIRLELEMSMAKDNRKELEKVLYHYKDDSLKLIAACFLIENMPYHFSKKEYFLSVDRRQYRPDVSHLNTKQQIQQYCDSLVSEGDKIVKEKKYDIISLDSAYLVNNIELAFAVWGKKWAKEINFEDFCRYILPYRVQAEDASDLRGYFMKRYLPLLEQVSPQTPLEACLIINQELMRTMHYDGTEGLDLYPSIEETYHIKMGICDDLCIFGIYVMRALGIPVAMEQTTWVKGDRGHTWAAVLSQGRFYPFAPCSDQPGKYDRMFTENRKRRPAKVYRMHFELVNKYVTREKDDGYVTYLKNPFLEDVITEYPNKTVDISVVTNKEYEKNKSQVYLCAYNMKRWVPFAMGERNNNNCSFKNIVGDNIFIIADSPDGVKLRFITVPFYVSPAGDVRKIILDKTKSVKHTLEKIKGQWDVMHTLEYWDTTEECFIPIQYEQQTDSTLTYSKIPRNAILRFTIPRDKWDIRIFLIENDTVTTY